MRISDWSSDVCSSDLLGGGRSSSSKPAGIHNIPSSSLASSLIFCGSHGGSQIRSTSAVAIPGTEPTRSSTSPGIDSATGQRSEEHTSELQSLMRISYAVFCLKKKNHHKYN